MASLVLLLLTLYGVAVLNADVCPQHCVCQETFWRCSSLAFTSWPLDNEPRRQVVGVRMLDLSGTGLDVLPNWPPTHNFPSLQMIFLSNTVFDGHQCREVECLENLGLRIIAPRCGRDVRKGCTHAPCCPWNSQSTVPSWLIHSLPTTPARDTGFILQSITPTEAGKTTRMTVLSSSKRVTYLENITVKSTLTDSSFKNIYPTNRTYFNVNNVGLSDLSVSRKPVIISSSSDNILAVSRLPTYLIEKISVFEVLKKHSVINNPILPSGKPAENVTVKSVVRDRIMEKKDRFPPNMSANTDSRGLSTMNILDIIIPSEIVVYSDITPSSNPLFTGSTSTRKLSGSFSPTIMRNADETSTVVFPNQPNESLNGSVLHNGSTHADFSSSPANSFKTITDLVITNVSTSMLHVTVSPSFFTTSAVLSATDVMNFTSLGDHNVFGTDNISSFPDENTGFPSIEFTEINSSILNLSYDRNLSEIYYVSVPETVLYGPLNGTADNGSDLQNHSITATPCPPCPSCFLGNNVRIGLSMDHKAIFGALAGLVILVLISGCIVLVKRRSNRTRPVRGRQIDTIVPSAPRPFGGGPMQIENANYDPQQPTGREGATPTETRYSRIWGSASRGNIGSRSNQPDSAYGGGGDSHSAPSEPAAPRRPPAFHSNRTRSPGTAVSPNGGGLAARVVNSISRATSYFSFPRQSRRNSDAGEVRGHDETNGNGSESNADADYSDFVRTIDPRTNYFVGRWGRRRHSDPEFGRGMAAYSLSMLYDTLGRTEEGEQRVIEGIRQWREVNAEMAQTGGFKDARERQLDERDRQDAERHRRGRYAPRYGPTPADSYGNMSLR